MKNSKPDWKFHWLTEWDEIWDDRFVPQWQAWLDNSFSAHVFFHPALVKVWVETYLPLRNIRPFFLIAESVDHTVFFPLVLWQGNWKNAFQRLLIPVGYSDYDYHDPIIIAHASDREFQPYSFWSAFLKELNQDHGVVRFDRFVLNGIRLVFAGSLDGWRNDESCPWLDLSMFKKPEEFLPSIKGSLRGDLRRQERRANEVGQLKHEIFNSGNETEALRELISFLNAYARRWPDSYKAPHFHENLIMEGMRAGLLHFSVLRIGDESAAWHLGFVFQGRYYYYLPAQNERYDRLSPGKMLLQKCVEDAIARRLSIYDFLRGDESYKAGWTDKVETLCSLEFDEDLLLSRIRNTVVDRVRSSLIAHF